MRWWWFSKCITGLWIVECIETRLQFSSGENHIVALLIEIIASICIEHIAILKIWTMKSSWKVMRFNCVIYSYVLSFGRFFFDSLPIFIFELIQWVTKVPLVPTIFGYIELIMDEKKITKEVERYKWGKCIRLMYEDFLWQIKSSKWMIR